MRWIKASERLPEVKTVYYIKIDNGGMTCLDFDGKVFRSDNMEYRSDRLFWLDESDDWIKIEPGCEMPESNDDCRSEQVEVNIHTGVADYVTTMFFWLNKWHWWENSKEVKDQSYNPTHWRPLPPSPNQKQLK